MHTYRTFHFAAQPIRVLTIGADHWAQSRDMCDALAWKQAPSHLLYSVAKPDRLVLRPGAVVQRQPVQPGLVPRGIGSITMVHLRALPALLEGLRTDEARKLLSWLEAEVFPAYGLRTPHGPEASLEAVRHQLMGMVQARAQELWEVEERIAQTAADLEALRTLRAMLETKHRQMLAALSELAEADDQDQPGPAPEVGQRQPEQASAVPEAVEPAPWD
jgi:prophage antirepressor-like protein